jgi:hypothetical protein
MILFILVLFDENNDAGYDDDDDGAALDDDPDFPIPPVAVVESLPPKIESSIF